MIRLDLIATTTGDVLASVPTEPVMVNTARRLLGGVVMPWNVIGSPSLGRAIFRPGSITVPDDPTRVKLLVEHDPNRSVGYLNAASELPTVLLASFRVVDGPTGDAAMAAALDRTRDGLSVRVEVDRWDILPGDVIEVLASRWRETSLVAIPAYDDARAAVLAAASPPERTAIMARLSHMLDLAATAPAPPADPPPTTPPAPTPPPVSNPPATPAPAQTPPAPAALDYAQLAAALGPALAAAIRPAEPAAPPPAPPRGRAPLTLTGAAETVARWQRTGSQNVGELMAALTDVVPANDAGEGLIRPQWLGELWTASQARRRYVDALGTPRRLTGLRAYGWRWVTKPVVADYAGNKVAIPSAAVATEPVTENAHRTAGGWDVDRAFIDLGEAGMVTAMFEAATEDYRVKSDTYTGAQLVAAAGANPATDGADFGAVISAIGAAAAGFGGQISFMSVAADVFAAIAALTTANVPWWFANGGMRLNVADQSGGVGQSFTFFVDAALAAGTYLAGDSRAASYYEEGDTPIRVQAINIPNGGVDLGVFGYNAVIVNDARLLFHGTIGGP